MSLLLALALAAQGPADQDPTWTERIAPVRIAANLYWVGSRDLAAVLVDGGKDGLVLIDAGVPEFAPQVLANIRALGFDPARVRILLNTQAHADHAGGLAAIKAATGARLLAARADAALMARGGKGDFAFADRMPYPPVTADGAIADGETITLGTARLTAHLMPGHTKGCTSWSIATPDGTALLVCGSSAPGYKLVGNAAYPDIVADFRRTFARIGALPCDIFLGAHGAYFDFDAKRARRGGDTNPFVDPDGCRTHAAAASQRFEAELKRQQAGAPAK